jgi:hypothetical protein
VLTFTSVFSFVVVVAGDSFITVVLLSFFSAGGLVTVVSFCSQATNNAMLASRQMYFFIQTESYFSTKLAAFSGLLFLQFAGGFAGVLRPFLRESTPNHRSS